MLAPRWTTRSELVSFPSHPFQTLGSVLLGAEVRIPPRARSLGPRRCRLEPVMQGRGPVRLVCGSCRHRSMATSFSSFCRKNCCTGKGGAAGRTPLQACRRTELRRRQAGRCRAARGELGRDNLIREGDVFGRSSALTPPASPPGVPQAREPVHQGADPGDEEEARRVPRHLHLRLGSV